MSLIPDEIYFLCLFHNVGAVNTDKSLSIDEISIRTALEPEKILNYIDKLIRTNYVQMLNENNLKKYHVTKNGILKVLSMYS